MDLLKEKTAFLEGFAMEERITSLKEKLALRTQRLTFVLENLHQAQNISAILRSCEIHGVNEVHIVDMEDNSPLRKGVTMGAHKWLDIKRYHEPGIADYQTCIKGLKERGYKVYAASPHHDAFTPMSLPVDQKTAVVMGTEKFGLSEEAKNSVDGYVKIPMHGFSESLNVSVSAAIIMNHFIERLHLLPKEEWNLKGGYKDQIYYDWIYNSVRNPESLLKRWKEEFTS